MNVATATSLLLCVASVGLWVRSYRVRDIVGFGRDGGNCHLIQSILGRFHMLSNLDGGCVGGVTYSSDRLSPKAVWHGGMSGYPREPQWRLGFIWQTYQSSHMGLGEVYTMSERLIVIPYWFPAGIFAIAPLAWIATTKRRFRLLEAMIIVAAAALGLAFLNYVVSR